MGGRVNIVERKNGVVKTINGFKIVQDLDYLNQNLPKDHWFLNQNRNHLPEALYPDGYGLMVIDFDTKWIGHCQGYTDPSNFFQTELFLSCSGCIVGLEKKDLPHSLFMKAWKAGAIQTMQFYDENNEIIHQPISKPFTFQNQTIQLDNQEKMRHFISQREIGMPIFFQYEPQGWTFERFKENFNGYFDFFKKLLELGFDMQFSLENWKSFVSKYAKYSDEDEDQDQDQDQVPNPNSENLLRRFDELVANHLRKNLNQAIPISKNTSISKKTI